MGVILYKILTIVGSLCFFMYGMKMMSDGIQRAAGSPLRNVLRAMTRNRFLGVFTGFLTTAVVQSSSATTVMTVSFVNAGLLTLTESAGVMMGANVGTTITGWLISILGLTVRLGEYSMPLFAIGVPLLLSSKGNLKYWGEAIIGFAILFLGLSFLKEAVPTLADNPDQLNFLVRFTEWGIFSRILFVLVGALITIIVQSSSAAMLVTLLLCYQGWLPLEVGGAMILGENIGTTITAEVAALVGNTSARRSARIHSLFNVIGVIWMIVLMPFVLHQLSVFVQDFVGLFEDHIYVEAARTYDNKITTYTLVAFHTVFNVVNVVLMLPFVHFLVKVATIMIPSSRDGEDEVAKLKFIDTANRTAELATVELQKETAHFGEIVARMGMFAKQLINSLEKQEQQVLMKRLKKYEKITDKMEIEITEYITKLSRQEITPRTSMRLRSILNICNDLERTGDLYYQLSKTVQQKLESKTYFTPDQRNNINSMFDKVQEAFVIMVSNLNNPKYEKVELDRAREVEKAINKMKKRYRDHNLSRLGDSDYNVNSAMIYNNVFSSLEKIGDHIYSVTEAIRGDVNT